MSDRGTARRVFLGVVRRYQGLLGAMVRQFFPVDDPRLPAVLARFDNGHGGFNEEDLKRIISEALLPKFEPFATVTVGSPGLVTNKDLEGAILRMPATIGPIAREMLDTMTAPSNVGKYQLFRLRVSDLAGIDPYSFTAKDFYELVHAFEFEIDPPWEIGPLARLADRSMTCGCRRTVIIMRPRWIGKNPKRPIVFALEYRGSILSLEISCMAEDDLICTTNNIIVARRVN